MPHETAAVSAQVQCTPYNHAPVYSVILFKATCIHRVHVCLALSAKWQGSFTCYCSDMWVEQIPKRVSTQSWPRRRKFPGCSCLGLEPESETFKSQVQYPITELSLLPNSSSAWSGSIYLKELGGRDSGALLVEVGKRWRCSSRGVKGLLVPRDLRDDRASWMIWELVALFSGGL